MARNLGPLVFFVDLRQVIEAVVETEPNGNATLRSSLGHLRKSDHPTSVWSRVPTQLRSTYSPAGIAAIDMPTRRSRRSPPSWARTMPAQSKMPASYAG